jgi:hypothetical protein
VREFEIRKVHLPYYLCPVIKNALKKENCDLEFYHIDENFFPACSFSTDDFILYSNYFGICTKNVRVLSEKYPNLIVDNAHSFYSPHFGFASFNSYRKFFFFSHNLKDGACLRVNKPLKNEYSKAETEDIQNDFSYNSMLRNEKRVDEFDIQRISDTSKEILKKINFDEDKKKRIEMFSELNEKYKSFNELSLKLEEDEIPFVYPFLTYDEKLAEKITKNNDLILRYWNTLPESFLEYRFYKYLIPIPLTNLINHC